MTNQEFALTAMRRAESCGLAIVTAESCSAGAVAHALSRAPGASKTFRGGFITYTKEMKTRILGVSPALLIERTAVCAAVAEAMTGGALQRADAGVAVAVTGVAGPDPDEDGNPVGLVWVAAATKTKNLSERLMIKDRPPEDVIRESVRAALALLVKICGV
jgi:nicotinamide-nucleotide amidase